MDCPTCCGTGELEGISFSDEKQHTQEEPHLGERASWPYACPMCGGSGYLEEAL